MAEGSLSEEARRQAAVFDQIGEGYEAIYGENPAQVAAVRWLIGRLPAGGLVLDLGSGTGVPTAQLLAEAGHRVVGIDISAEMIRIARAKVPAATFYQMDVADLRLDEGPFDGAAAFFSLLMLRRAAIEAALARLAGLLRPGAPFVLAMVELDADYMPIPFLDQTVHVSGYTREGLRAAVEAAGFRVLDLQTQEFASGGDAPPETQIFCFAERPAAT